jgi:choice-of-anchor C domain-containing protein
VNLVGPTGWRAAIGNQALDLNGDHPASTAGAITQSFDTVPAQQYAVSFYLAGNPACAPAVKTLTVQVGGIAKVFSFDTTGRSPSAMGWRPEAVRFTATSDRTTLRLASTTDPNSDCGPAIDEVKVVARRAAH